MHTRFPFRYGISSLTWVPHLVVTAEIECRGQTVLGMAADGLPPKWFSKNPATSFETDLAEMIAVIQNAARLGRVAGEREQAFPDWWQSVQAEQKEWVRRREIPGLLAGFGTSLMERAVLDALCRATETPLHALLQSGALFPDLAFARPELAGLPLAAFLPAAPRPRLIARHTVGLADWLAEADIGPAERIEDGLPQSLEACTRHYGLTHFKIKVSGDLEADRARLRQIDQVLAASAPADWRCTLDGNEAFTQAAAFRAYFDELRADTTLRTLLTERLLFVEQPLRRDASLVDDLAGWLADWPEAPPLLIDEADGDLAALPQALRLGYSGVSHKNCKGIVKGLANAASLHLANRHDGKPRFLSGEDLVNVGPVALMQDLAMQALLGIEHVERNGHHYMKGLSMWPAAVQDAAARAHPDVLQPLPQGFPAVAVRQGQIDLASVHAAPFGCALSPARVTAELEPLDAWIKRGGLAP